MNPELKHIRDKLLDRGEVYLAVVKEGERTGDKNNERYKRAYKLLKAIVQSLKKLNERISNGENEDWNCFYSDATGSLVINFTVTPI